MKQKSNLTAIFQLTLYGLLILSVLVLTLVGCRLYSALTARQARNRDNRQVLAYVAGRVAAGDAAGAVTLTDGPQGPALQLAEDTGFCTRIFLADGTLYEQYSHPDTPCDPADAQPIVGLEQFDLTLEGNLLRVTCTTGSTNIYLRAAGQTEVGSHA